MKILVLSRYNRAGASSRYRYYQYVPFLQEQGALVTVVPLLGDTYLQRFAAGLTTPLRYILQAYGRRLTQLVQVRRYDLLWLEAEALPWVPAPFEALLYKLGVPYVVDYDDAIFHRYDRHPSWIIRQLLGTKIDRVMRSAALVIAGNDYLAQRAYRAGASRVEILPTVIDLGHYAITPQPHNTIFTIGWIGSRSSAAYFNEIRPALQALCQCANIRIRTVGAPTFALEGVPLEAKSWCETTEVQELQQFDVGIMPLRDSPWERGKCGFKLIQYMACARPVIGSPVGVNTQIIEHGVNGFLATSTSEWIQAVQRLMHDPTLRQRMGAAGRAKVEEHYCLQVTAPKLAQLFREVIATQG